VGYLEVNALYKGTIFDIYCLLVPCNFGLATWKSSFQWAWLLQVVIASQYGPFCVIRALKCCAGMWKRSKWPTLMEGPWY
jgi:hypothetical protein